MLRFRLDPLLPCAAYPLGLVLVLLACSGDDSTARTDTHIALDTFDVAVPDTFPDTVVDTLPDAVPDTLPDTDEPDLTPDIPSSPDASPDVLTCPTCGPLASCADPLVGCVCDAPDTMRLVGNRCYLLDFIDPDLDLDPANAWTTTGTNAEHLTTGDVDPGSWRFFYGLLTQTLDTPPFGSVPKLAVDVYGKNFFESGAWELGTQDRWVALPRPGFDARIPVRQCLGEAGYGDATLFSLATRFVTVDRITLVTDETCPDPGVLLNGDFDDTDDPNDNGAWRLEDGATIVSGAVSAGNPGIELPIDNPCTPARATQLISVPLDGVNAVRFKAKVRPNTTLGVELRDRYPVSASVQTDGATQTVSFCFTHFELGTVMPLTFVPIHVTGGTVCTPGYDGLAAVDDVELIDDPSCDPEALVSDSSFSRLGPLIAANHMINGVKRTTLTAPDAFDDRSLQITALPCPPNNYAEAWVDVATRWPQRTAESGPAVRFVYKTTGAPTGFVGTTSTTFPHAATWTPWSACTNGNIDGFMGFVRIGLQTCGDHTLAIDDIEVYSDPACKSVAD